MVLEEAASSSPDSFTDDPYSSDNDPYATQSIDGATQQITLDLSKFSMPIPIIGGLVGYPKARVARSVTQRLQSATSIMQRPLNLDEVNAITEYQTYIETMASYGATGGAALAMRNCYIGRSSYRFPFWSPPTDGWPPESVGPFRGNVLRIGLHLLRIPPYWFIGTLVGGYLLDTYATLVSAEMASRDKRVADIKAKMASRREEMRTAARDTMQRRPGRETMPQSREGQQVATRSADDMSPTSGAWQDSPSDTSVLSDSQMRAQEIRQSPGPRRSQAESVNDAFSMGNVSSQPDSFDDASPTGGMGPMDSSVSGGSAWERIRQQAASGQSPAAGRTASGGFNRRVQGEQQQDSTLGDSFTFSRTDEEKQLAKAQAQREFDAQIDRERNGGDFGDSGRRW